LTVLARFLAGQAAADGVQDAVDEDGRFLAAEPPGDLDGFVDDDGRDPRLRAEHLEDGDPQDVPVDDGHPGDAPVLGGRLDGAVDLLLTLPDAPDEPVGVFFDIVRGFLVLPETADDLRGVRRVELQLKKDL